MNDRSMTVLLIAGSGRSGSTLLARMLGSVEGCVVVGELRYLWQRGLVEHRRCGCGERLDRCPFWTEVLRRAFGAGRPLDAQDVAERLRERTRMRQLARVMTRPRARRDADPLLGSLGELYRAVAAVSGCSVVVDSSKLPTYGRLLEDVPGIDLRVIQLVRDPRATAYSWSRAKPLTDGAASALMQRQSAAKAALLWDIWNWAAGRLWPESTGSVVVRYEDLAAAPRATVGRITACMGLAGEPPFLDDRTVSLERHHTVAGNADRLSVGPTVVAPDESWRRGLRRRDRLTVTLLTRPLLGRYGYATRTSAFHALAPTSPASPTGSGLS